MELKEGRGVKATKTFRKRSSEGNPEEGAVSGAYGETVTAGVKYGEVKDGVCREVGDSMAEKMVCGLWNQTQLSSPLSSPLTFDA